MNTIDYAFPWGPAQYARMLSGYARGGETGVIPQEQPVIEADLMYAQMAAGEMEQDGRNN